MHQLAYHYTLYTERVIETRVKLRGKGGRVIKESVTLEERRVVVCPEDLRCKYPWYEMLPGEYFNVSRRLEARVRSIINNNWLLCPVFFVSAHPSDREFVRVYHA